MRFTGSVHRLFNIKADIARGTDKRPPAFFKLEPYLRTDSSRSRYHHKWNIAGNCRSPVHRELYSRQWADTRHSPLALKQGPFQWLEITARCRSCSACLEQRASLWRGRLLGELRHWQEEGHRTWFVTLTANPSMRTLFTMKARQRWIKTGKGPNKLNALKSTEFDELTETQRFGLIHQEISLEITLWLKRLRETRVSRWRQRKQGEQAAIALLGWTKKRQREHMQRWRMEHPKPKPAKIRYLIVTEAHKSEDDPTKKNFGRAKGGVFPHYHVLIHEVEGRLYSDDIKNQWRARIGFADVREVKGEAEKMLYLCKYLTKDSRARVRASVGYGQYRLSDQARDTTGLVKMNSPSKQDSRRVIHLETDQGGVWGVPPPQGITGDKSDGLSSTSVQKRPETARRLSKRAFWDIYKHDLWSHARPNTGRATGREDAGTRAPVGTRAEGGANPDTSAEKSTLYH